MEKLVVKVPRFGPLTEQAEGARGAASQRGPGTVRLLPSCATVGTCNWQVVGETGRGELREDQARGKSHGELYRKQEGTRDWDW